MIWTCRLETQARSIIQPEPSLLSLLLWDLQPVTSPNPLHALVVHTPARSVEQTRHHTITITAILVRQLYDIVGQTLLISTALRNFALRGAMMTKCAAGAALGYAQLLPHMIDAFAARRRA